MEKWCLLRNSVTWDGMARSCSRAKGPADKETAMITLGHIMKAAAMPECYIAIWRDGEIYIEPVEACPFSGPKADPRG